MKNPFPFLLLFFIYAIPSYAQNSDSTKNSQIVFSLPLIDLPYQIDAAKTVNQGQATFGSFLKGYANPSMHLSLDLSADLYTGVHYGINSMFRLNSRKNYMKDWSSGKRFLYYLTTAGTDFVLSYAPGFNGWEHEEFHRSVMTRFHVNSFNDMNKFPIGQELISVSHVKDEDLERFKYENPYDFIRMHVAGIEGEYLLIDKLQKNNFYYKQNLPHEFLYLFSTINSISYVQISTDSEIADPITDKANQIENTIEERDFTGLDFTAWVYDLFRPNDFYITRGGHPSGIGFDRYIKTTDLTYFELSYLHRQGKLQWFNAISPMLFGVKSMKFFNTGFDWNFSFRHVLTSFGNDISGNIFLMNTRHKFYFSFHNYQNYFSYFPAIEAQIIDFEKSINNLKIYISPRLLLGVQPQNQSFTTDNSNFIGLAECKIEFKSQKILNPFVEISAKSKGWIAGNAFLDKNFSCRIGITTRLTIYK